MGEADMKLHSKSVAALVLGDKPDVIYWDDQVRGFGYRLRRARNGEVQRSWVAQYRQGKVTRRLKLGSAEILNAEKARIAAKVVLARVALTKVILGDNPPDKLIAWQREQIVKAAASSAPQHASLKASAAARDRAALRAMRELGLL